MAKRKPRKVKFDKNGIDNLPSDKPVVYKILNRRGKNIYTGVAKKGRVKSRLREHLSKGKDSIPGGSRVKIQQKKRISDAKKMESNIIKRTKPKYNKR